MGYYNMNVRKIAFIAIFSATALIISLFENLLPPILPILPFAKVGISHIIILAAIIMLGKGEAMIVFAVRTVFVAIFSGNPTMLLYSLPAGLVSLLIMILLLKSGKFGLPAISAASGSMHNLVQICIAALITRSAAVFAYLPYLMTFGAIAGIVTGIVCCALIKKLPSKIFDY